MVPLVVDVERQKTGGIKQHFWPSLYHLHMTVGSVIQDTTVKYNRATHQIVLQIWLP